MEVFSKFICFLILCVFLSIYSAFALTLVWDWFVVDFFGVQSIGIAMALGLSLVSQFLFTSIDLEGFEDKERMSKFAIASISKSTMTILSGWVYFQFI